MTASSRVTIFLALCLSSSAAFSPSGRSAPASTVGQSQSLTTGRRPRKTPRTRLHFSASSLFNLSSSATNEDDSYLPTRQVNHRHSAKDWMYNVRSLPQSTILREVRNPVLTIIAWSTLVSVLHKLFLRSVTFRHLALHMQVGPSAHSFLVSSLGLLLVFRTNSAYQRFAVSIFL